MNKISFLESKQPSLKQTGARAGGGKIHFQSVHHFFLKVFSWKFWDEIAPTPDREWDRCIPVAIMLIWLSLALGASGIMHVVIYLTGDLP